MDDLDKAARLKVAKMVGRLERAMRDVAKRLNVIDQQAQKAFSGFDELGNQLTILGKKIKG